MECVRRFLKAVETHSSLADVKVANTADIDDYLRFVAKTGKTHVPWKKLKSVLIARVSKVIDDFFDEQCNDKQSECPASEASKCLQTKDRIIQCLVDFEGIPFTIQRLAELIVEPRKNYKRVDKFLRAIEKNVMVITTIDPLGNRIVTESQQSMANAWNENLFPPPSPSSRVRRMSIDELVDTSSSNVASPQMVAAAMMPPPPSPPPFSPKQQKSPLPVDNNSDMAATSEIQVGNLGTDSNDKVDDIPVAGDAAETTTLNGGSAKSLTKKPVIVWHSEGAKKPAKFQAVSKIPSVESNSKDNGDTIGKSSEPVGVGAAERLSSEDSSSSPQKAEPSPKKQRFSNDGCDCDSTTPDSDNSSALVLPTVT